MNILVISPHPDDETLGAGGTILRHKSRGDKVYWLNITNMKEEYGFNPEKVSKRKAEIDKVIAEYKFDGYFDLGLKPAGLDEYGKNYLTDEITKIVSEVKPNTVILPFMNDIHTDHKVLFEAAFSCTKIFRHEYVKRVMMMEILSETDFVAADDEMETFAPNYFVDISDQMEKKIEIMKLYDGEINEHPFPRSERSIKALGTLRGAQSGCEYAEGFKVVKFVEDDK